MDQNDNDVIKNCQCENCNFNEGKHFCHRSYFECSCKCCKIHEYKNCPNGEVENGRNPNRPGRIVGVDRGRINDSTPLTVGDFNSKNPSNSWAGERKNLFLPFLFMRANPGDNGSRPVEGIFWESPDILILAGIDPSSAPSIPPTLGQTANAEEPNTIYAHVWNFGQAQAAQVIVEFYWCDPSLGINSGSAHLIGQEIISLGARGSGKAHTLVKCSKAWIPSFINGGHECIVVRVWDYTSDALGTPQWDASINRHVAQRNIHVIPAHKTQEMMLMRGIEILNIALLQIPLTIKVGPLYGMPAQVNVTRVKPSNMPWLQLHTGERGKFPLEAVPTGIPMLSQPFGIGGGKSSKEGVNQHTVVGDDQQVAFSTSDAPPKEGEAHIYRVIASQGDQIFGGYTVVLLG